MSDFFTRVAHSRARILDHPGHSPQKVHGGSGGGDDDFDEDEFVGEDASEGEYGYGVDTKGVSYTEFDVDTNTGEPKFPQSYRDEHGPLIFDSGALGKTGTAVAIGEKRGIHVADDSAGTQARQVVQEFTPKQARAVAEGVYEVYNGDRESFTTLGVTVRPAGANPTRDGVEVTWANGKTTRFEGEAGDDEAFALQDALNLGDKSVIANQLSTFHLHVSRSRARMRRAVHNHPGLVGAEFPPCGDEPGHGESK